MILYLVKGYLDLAATTLADAQALLTALANPALASNQAIIDKVTGKLETLVQSDSGEPLTISSIDDAAGSYSAWVTDAQTTLAVGLGLPNTSTLDTYASTTSFSITGNTRTGTLALNSRELSNGLLRGGLRLQIRTTNSAGAAETRGLLRINVVPGVLESPVGDRDVDYTSYVEVAALATAAAASAAAATTAETNAETAETNAETAQAAAALSAAAALVSENAASASASTATTQAGTATTQAGTATTQAGIATTQAGLAAAAKTAAETAETNAETAETNAETAEAAAAISAAAALVSEAAALVSKNAAAASAATASAVSGSGNGTFSAAALTGVNSVTASASTALTLTGGSTGASLVLGQGTTAGSATLTATGTGIVSVAGAASSGPATYAAQSRAGFTSYQETSGSFGYNRYLDIVSAQGADGTNGGGVIRLLVNSISSGSVPSEVARVTKTGNLLIGTTTDITGTGGLHVAGTSTASNVTSGALRVGSNIGFSGNAGGPSYFGGDVALGTTTATVLTHSVVNSKTAGQGDAYYLASKSANGYSNGLQLYKGGTPQWTIGSGITAVDDNFKIYDANAGVVVQIAKAATLASTTVAFNNTGATTFAGAVSIAGTVIHTLSATPASASATGTVGTMSWDASYIYICTAANTWKRVAIATW